MNLEEFLSKKNVDQKLSELILFFSENGKTIKSGFLTSQKKADTKNTYGEEQMELDKWADEVLINGLRKNRLVRYISTEEQADMIEIDNPKNQFILELLKPRECT